MSDIMKDVRGILIDPVAKTITEVTLNGDYKEIHKQIGADCFDAVYVDRRPDGSTEAIFVDDEGLYREGQEFFLWRGYAQPLAGRGLILGANEEGDTVSTRLSLDQVKNKVSFVPLKCDGFKPIPEGTTVERYGKTWPVVGHTPLFSRKGE